jgi:hypothetical protein
MSKISVRVLRLVVGGVFAGQADYEGAAQLQVRPLSRQP